MDGLLTFCIVYAFIGFVISLSENVLAIIGIPIGGNGFFFAMQFSIFPMWFYLVAVVFKRMFSGGMRRNQFWTIALSGCPKWMQYFRKIIFAYFVINLLIEIITTVGAPKQPPGSGPPASVWRTFSAGWMMFYYIGLMSFISARRIGWNKLAKRCPNGHDVSWTDAFCPICGSRIVE